MRGLSLLLVSSFWVVFGFAQGVDTANVPVWIDMMQDQNANFFETQKAFEMYWDGRTRTKGDGYKPFKRWEWFMQYEINPDGSFRNPNDIQQEVMQFKGPAGNQPAAPGGMAVQSTSGKWENLGPINKAKASSGQPNGMGRINGIGLHPTNDSIIFICSPNGGIWRTYDHGKTWTSNTDTNYVMQMSEIKFNPKNPQIVYAGTGDRDAGARTQRGVMKSTDGGVSWSSSNNGMGNVTVGKMIIDPNHPDTLVAATSRGVYRTTDGGANWSRRSATSNFKDIVANPSNFNVQYAATGGSFYRSSNGGLNWVRINLPVNGNRIAIAATAQDPSYVYVVQTSRRAFAGLLLSKDTGKTFTTQSTSPNLMDWSTTGSGTGGQAWYDLDIASDPKNKRHVYVGGVNVFKSIDEGKTWRINSHWTGSGGVPAAHADHHVFEWSADGDRLYDGNDGGIYFTNNGGQMWSDLSSGLAISEVYKIGQHAYKEDRVICGYQDNGSAIYRGTGDWTTEIGGDGMECAFDYSNDTYVYGSLYYGSVRRSRNSGRNFSSITGGISEQGAWVAPWLLDEGDPRIMYIGMNSNIWRTTNVRANRVTWTNITSSSVIGGSGSWSVMESSPADPNILYAVRSGKTMVRSDNAHAASPTWTNITSNLPGGNSPSDIEAHPTNPNIVYVTMGSRVHVSTDKGLTWTDITGNLPNTAKRTIVYDKTSRGGLYVGGTPFVYYKDSSMTNWIEYSNNLPGDVSVTELEIFYDTLSPTNSRLRAGTYGRGLWSVDLFEINNRKATAVLLGDTGVFCLSKTAKFSADSSKRSENYNWFITPTTGYSYINGTSDTSKNIEVNFTNDGFYTIRLVASNYFGGDTVELKNGILVLDAPTGYCATSTAASTATNQGILNVELRQINNSTIAFNGVNAASDFTCTDFATLMPDSMYSISVTTGNNEFAKVYIDYNRDGDFTDAGEEVASFTQASGKRTLSFRTPLNPVFNKALRMRVISDVNAITGPCSRLASGQSEDYSVLMDVPTADIVFSKANPCPNEWVQVSATTTGKVDSVYWDFGPFASPKNATGIGPHRVKAATAGWWVVKIRLNDGVWYQDSVQIQQSPVADVLLDSANSSLCEGGYARLFVNNNTGVKGVFKWYKNGSEIQGKTDSVLVEPGLRTFAQYNYVVVTGNGVCSDTSSAFTITPHDRPNAWIGLLKTSQCLVGNSFEFKDNSLFQGGSLTRNWNFGDGNSDTSKTATHVYSNSGVFNARLVVTSDKNCSDTSFQQATVYAMPDTNYTAKRLGSYKYQFTPNDTTLASYNWNFGDGNFSTVKKPNHTYAANGVYVTTLSVANANCTDSSTVEVIVEEESISVGEFSKQYGISVYPNPAKGVIYFNTNYDGMLHLELMDVSGRLLQKHQVNAANGITQLKLDNSGIYLLRVSVGNQQATYRIENL